MSATVSGCSVIHEPRRDDGSDAAHGHEGREQHTDLVVRAAHDERLRPSPAEQEAHPESDRQRHEDEEAVGIAAVEEEHADGEKGCEAHPPSPERPDETARRHGGAHDRGQRGQREEEDVVERQEGQEVLLEQPHRDRGRGDEHAADIGDRRPSRGMTRSA
ncbi:hypothetical protein [Microbacterium binotii]|uniref:Uncharacterized protein n=1 Tax=Microbacterium binotii TaxID=462710 RepID=A0ABN3PD28_9MICO